MRERIN